MVKDRTRPPAFAGASLGMAVPADRYRPSPRSMPARLMEPEYDERDIVRKVGTTKAYIQFKGRPWPVGQAVFGERVAIRPRGRDGHYGVFFVASDRRNRPGNEVRCRPCSRTEHLFGPSRPP